MILNINKEIILEEISNVSKITVFGEAHFHWDEVKEIRNKINSLKPDLIIHELDFEELDLKKKFKVVPLEPSNKIGKKYPKDIKKQFKIREKEMSKTILKYLNKYKNIVIVVGDTHIRETNEYFGNHDLHTFLKNIGAKIIRSKYGEIK